MFLFLVFATLGYFISFGYEEGTLDDGSIIVSFIVAAFRWLFILIAFPVWFVFETSFFSATLYFGIILFDCLFYSLLIEISLTTFKRYKLKKRASLIK